MSKGKKPGKPISKKVIALNYELKRRSGVRELKKRFLIVCEDDKSAPNYFECLKRHFKLSATSITIAGSGGRSQPVQVVERAIELKKASNDANSGTEPFSEIWCIIDGDYGTKINNARFKANANNVSLAISTKCFEYWILLHFESNNISTLDCSQVIRTLRKNHLPGYQKGKVDFSSVVTKVNDARARAEQIRKPGIARGEPPENQNPCSDLYLLIEKIL